ncbi:MAG: ABC transporter permease subunit [Sphaerochaetaceae bacterium]
MKNVYKYEFKTNFKTVLIWLISLMIVSWVLIVFYQSAILDIQEFNKFLSGYSEDLLKALQFDFSNLFSFENYFSGIILYINLCLAIEASILSFSIFTKELKLKLSDYLYSKPLTRSSILFQKFMAGLSLLVLEFLFLLAFNLVVANTLIPEVELVKLSIVDLSMFFVLIVFYSFSFFLSCIMKNWKNPNIRGIEITMIFFMFKIINNIGSSGDFVDYLKYISFFDYSDPRVLALNNFYSIENLCLILAIVVLSLIFGFSIFKRKNLQSS